MSQNSKCILLAEIFVQKKKQFCTLLPRLWLSQTGSSRDRLEQDSKMFAVIHKKKLSQSITGIINISLSCRRHSMKALQTLALIN